MARIALGVFVGGISGIPTIKPAFVSLLMAIVTAVASRSHVTGPDNGGGGAEGVILLAGPTALILAFAAGFLVFVIVLTLFLTVRIKPAASEAD